MARTSEVRTYHGYPRNAEEVARVCAGEREGKGVATRWFGTSLDPRSRLGPFRPTWQVSHASLVRTPVLRLSQARRRCSPARARCLSCRARHPNARVFFSSGSQEGAAQNTLCGRRVERCCLYVLVLRQNGHAPKLTRTHRRPRAATICLRRSTRCRSIGISEPVRHCGKQWDAPEPRRGQVSGTDKYTSRPIQHANGCPPRPRQITCRHDPCEAHERRRHQA